METVGQKLRAARGRRKLSLEDASRATKIRSQQLADLERDQYSNFPNLAYAKGFLLSYGKYLDVDVRPSLGAFEDANTFGLDNYQYLSDTPLGVYRATRRPTRRRAGRHRYTLVACALGAVALTFLFWQLYVSYQRLGDLDKLAEHQEALERRPDGPAASKAVPGSASSASPAKTANDGADEAAGAAVQTDLLLRPGRLPALPLPDDGGALRQLLPDGMGTPGPFFISGDSALPSSLGEKHAGERTAWSPENPEGYRFYVRSLDRNSVEIFRMGVPRPETVLNNPL